ncbi:hypothetical protein D9M72_652910 [compost metagenome]
MYLLGTQVGLGLGYLGASDAGVGGQRSDSLFGDVAGLAQGLRAVQVDLRAAEGGLAGVQVRRAGGDQARLGLEFAACLGQFRFSGGEGGLGSFQSEPEITVLQSDQ